MDTGSHGDVQDQQSMMVKKNNKKKMMMMMMMMKKKKKKKKKKIQCHDHDHLHHFAHPHPDSPPNLVIESWSVMTAPPAKRGTLGVLGEHSQVPCLPCIEFL